MTGSSRPLVRYLEEIFIPQELGKAEANTVKQYRNAVRRFTRWSGCDIQVHLVTETLVERFGRSIVADGMSVNNARKYVAYVRRVARHRYPDRCLKQMGKRPHEWKPVTINGLSEDEMNIPGSCLKFFQDEYLPRRLIGAAQSSCDNYRHNLNRFARFLGRVPMMTDLNDNTVVEFQSWMMTTGLSASSANCSRASLLALWRYGLKRRVLTEGPKDVEKLKERQNLPEAWTMEQMGKIIEAARSQPRPVRGIPCRPGVFFETLILVAYDTALRLRALRNIRRSDWNADRSELTVEAEHMKHKVSQTFAVSEQTAQALNQMISESDSEREIIFDWPIQEEALHFAYRQILKRAGLYKGPRDSFHKLRRTAASHLTKVLGIEAASRQLGHSSVQMTRRYVDPRMTGDHRAADHLPRPKLPSR